MALLSDIKTVGKLQMTVYHYEQPGDELQVHTHTVENNHITIIGQGSFRVTGAAAIRGTILKPGTVVDWPAGQEHGFVALEPNSRMIQIQK